ncbi:hypothetical protein HKK55_27310 [Pseudomonas sp. ADAK18]|uniref:hypothetical protein n=1 Tax=Pseudomonas sp. ADAK18 TaxID=2730848 RepID=UPI001463FB5C|nr:hypothetical protein [Pseudomonas sp. ADAK18]QJI32247.1 hypothetical protein HKK55_27310 [Pseudomonas sp. ADAK18]
MIVKRCEWISKDAQEAMLTIGDENFECVAFSHPCSMQVGDRLREPLLAISIRGATKAELNAQPVMQRLGESFAHEFLAEVIDLKERLVVVGSVVVELDDVLPGEISVGDLIRFSCGRLDVIS